ncbi:MAG: TRAP transporter TatT component family protein [Myxococcota bacterium]
MLVLVMLTAACGPGRQAAWEKESSAKQQRADGAGEAQADQATPLKDQATEAWEKREDRGQLERAIALWEEALRSEPESGTILAKLSRAYYLLGDGYKRLADEKDTMLPTLEKGVDYGERAMMAISPAFAARVRGGEKVEKAVEAMGPEGLDAVYWYAANLGKFAAEKGFTTQLFYKDRLFAVMQRVLELDPTYFHAAPHRYFGAFYAKAPSFAGGDMTKSKEHFDKAVENAPGYLGTKVLYAEMYATKQDDKELFTRLLNEVKSADPSTLAEVTAENKVEQRKAERLLSRMDDLF